MLGHEPTQDGINKIEGINVVDGSGVVNGNRIHIGEQEDYPGWDREKEDFSQWQIRIAKEELEKTVRQQMENLIVSNGYDFKDFLKDGVNFSTIVDRSIDAFIGTFRDEADQAEAGGNEAANKFFFDRERGIITPDTFLRKDSPTMERALQASNAAFQLALYELRNELEKPVLSVAEKLKNELDQMAGNPADEARREQFSKRLSEIYEKQVQFNDLIYAMINSLSENIKEILKERIIARCW